MMRTLKAAVTLVLAALLIMAVSALTPDGAVHAAGAAMDSLTLPLMVGLAGLTKDQQAMRDYHETDFQTHDPVTGQKRKTPLPAYQDDAIRQAGAFDNSGANATDAAIAEADAAGLDLTTVKGSGADGKITVQDVRDAIAARDGE